MKTRFKLIFFFSVLLFSCKKDWLEAKPDKKLAVPVSLSDLQALLDNNVNAFNSAQPSLGEIGSDDYYISFPDWQELYSNTERNAYIWAKDVYEGEEVNDWKITYRRVFYENYVLENIENISHDSNNAEQWNNVKGSALFGRGFDFYSLADEFEKPYDNTTAAGDPGIVLRLHSDINEKATRATVEETYDQIISDLTNAVDLLPGVGAFKTRPSKMSAYAMLARTYLNKDDYATALQYADSCLALHPPLLDYNDFDANKSYPFPKYNDEVIYDAAFNYPDVISRYYANVDSTLYVSYDTNDLRKYLFFKTSAAYSRFKGGYDGYTGFAGIATDEIYLMRAECYARTGNVLAAMNDLNTLLVTRWKAGTYVPLSSASADEALGLILQERRKELIFRGLRWTDLRRLNKDLRFAITLTRNLSGQIYTLPPNDSRYTYAIPDQEIQLSDIQQNPR